MSQSRHSDPSLKLVHRIAFSCGIVGNWATACMRFSYLLLFLTKVIGMTSTAAATLLLIAQLADGLSTPIIGYLSDSYSCCLPFYTKRKTWHFFASLIQVVAPIMLFQEPLYLSKDELNPVTNETAYFWWYVPWVTLFTVSYAVLQVNHFAMIPELSDEPGVRTMLNSWAYSGLLSGFVFTYVVAIYVLGDGITLSSLNFLEDEKQCRQSVNVTSPNKSFGPDDLETFQTLVIIVVTGAMVVNTAFHALVKEKPPKLSPVDSDVFEGSRLIPMRTPEETEAQISYLKSMLHWFKNPQFYITVLIYIVSQLSLGLTVIYTPMYLTEKHTWISKTWMVYLQIVYFISGIPITMAVKVLGNRYGMQVPFFLGCTLLSIGAILMEYASCSMLLMLCIFICLGAGANCLTCSAMALVAILIGPNTTTGAFVFALCSLSDKLSIAFSIQFIGVFEGYAEHKGDYYKSVISIGLIGIVSVGLLAVCVQWWLQKRIDEQFQDMPSESNSQIRSPSNVTNSLMNFEENFLPVRVSGIGRRSSRLEATNVQQVCASLHSINDMTTYKL